MHKDKNKFENVILFPENKIKKKPTPVDPKAKKENERLSDSEVCRN